MTSDAEAGFSLVEILIVLAIVGIMSGLTVISLGAVNRSAQPDTEANLFANRVSLALDEALVTGMPLALNIDQNGYVFEVKDEDGKGWIPYPSQLLGSRHELAEGIRLEGSLREGRVPILPDGTGSGFSVIFSNGGSSWKVTEDGLSTTVASLVR